MHVEQQFVWNFLRVEAVANEESPPTYEPVDADLIASLIDAAEKRVETMIGGSLDDLNTIPGDMALAIAMDVSVHYFNRINPELPELYWQLLMPFRSWGFGRDTSEEGSA